MENPISTKLYDDFRRIYSEKTDYGSLERGQQIERLVSSIIQGIVDPLRLDMHIARGKTEFDGEVTMDKHESILYQVFAGRLSEFRYKYLLELVRSTYLPWKTYFLIITSSFSSRDKKAIGELAEKTSTDKVKMCFVDYETLITLHHFVSEKMSNQSDKNLKILKRLFLKELFDSTSLVREKMFANALSSALTRYSSRFQARGASFNTYAELREIENRIEGLEKMVETILKEIRTQRTDSQRKGSQRRSLLEDVDFIHKIDLTNVKGEGTFPCPKCGNKIDPDDETGDAYEIIDAIIRKEELVEVMVSCKKCGTRIILKGFVQSFEGSPKGRITKKSIRAYLQSMK